MGRLADIDEFLENDDPTPEEIVAALKQVRKEMAEERAKGEQK